MRRRRAFRSAALLFVGVASCSTFGDELPDSTPTPSADGGATEDVAIVDGGSSPCRSKPADAWSAPRPLGLVGASGEVQFKDPFVTADGLTLYVSHLDGAGWRVFRAQRTSRSAPWSTPSELPGFRAPAYATPYPSALSGPTGEVVAAVAGVHTDVGAIVLDGGSWAAAVYKELQRPDIELAPTMTADGTTVVYLEVNAPRPTDQFRILLQSSRGAPALSSPWGATREIAEGPDGASALPPGFESPALTPDGLGLFYATSDAPHLVRYTTRKVRTGSFFGSDSSSSTVESLSADAGFKSRVRSITQDECEAYLTSDRGGVEEAWFSTRR